jgi:transcriptional regulator with GAF, ATPase, and Fis domain
MDHFNQKLEQLHADEAKIKQQIAQEQHKLQRLQNRKSYYDKGERAQRTHRLITRGAAMESIVPEVKIMSEKEFYALMSAILTRPDITRLIHASTHQNGGD